MSAPWIVAFLSLSGIVLLLAVTLLGLLRRVTGVLERTEARLAEAPAQLGGGAAPGTKIPAFEVLSAEGKPVSSSELFSRPAVALFLSAGCQPCRKLVAELTAGDASLSGVPLLAFIEDTAAAREFPLAPELSVFYQRQQAAAAAFQSTATPQAFAVDAGEIVYERTVPGSRRHLLELATRLRQGGEPLAEPDVRNVVRATL